MGVFQVFFKMNQINQYLIAFLIKKNQYILRTLSPNLEIIVVFFKEMSSEWYAISFLMSNIYENKYLHP